MMRVEGSPAGRGERRATYTRAAPEQRQHVRSAARPAVCSAMASFDKAAMADKLAKVNSSQGSIESTCVCAREARARASGRPPKQQH